MVVVKAVVLKHQQKEDGTYNIKYRITKDRKSAYIASPYFASASDLTDKFKLKDGKKKRMADREVLNIGDYLETISNDIRFMSAKDIVKVVADRDKAKDNNISFLLHLQEEIDQLKKEGKQNASNYNAVYNHLSNYTKNKLYCSEITPAFLSAFEKHLIKEGLTSSGISKYMGCIRASFNRAKNLYNDEDLGIIKIPNNPFTKYKVPKEQEPEKRDAGLDVVLDIIQFKPETGYQELARDLFLLSFYLIGVNARDLHNNDMVIENGRLIYQRSKTKDKRADRAEISVNLEPEVLPLMEKYKGHNDSVFIFNERFLNSTNMNKSLSRGFKQIRDKLGYTNLTFYSARHSWATIASYHCNIIDSHIARCLNHVSLDFKTTNRYIKRDWSLIDKCNRQVLDFVKQTLEKRQTEDKKSI